MSEQVERVCVAYESGYGRGMSGRDLAQPYADGSDEAQAYSIGYSTAAAKVRGKTFTTEAETMISAAGSGLMADLFNLMPIKALEEVPVSIAARISRFMVANGYRIVFNRWYLQAEPAQAETTASAALERIVSTYDAYRRKGVMPARVEYAAVVEAIDAARPVVNATRAETKAQCACTW